MTKWKTVRWSRRTLLGGVSYLVKISNTYVRYVKCGDCVEVQELSQSKIWARENGYSCPRPTSFCSRTWCSFVETRLIIFVLRKWINIESGLKMASSGVNGWMSVFIVKCGKLDCFPAQYSWSVLLVCVTVVQLVKWLGCRLDTGELGFYFQQGNDIPLFCKSSTPTPDTKHPPIRN
jgi:hypothetical protein